tara:strand:- start:82 stop:315 length:234 start_codon:yes stop_codon:yes gene_type:complete
VHPTQVRNELGLGLGVCGSAVCAHWLLAEDDEAVVGRVEGVRGVLREVMLDHVRGAAQPPHEPQECLPGQRVTFEDE